MILSAIAAMSRNRVVGVENRLPWQIPEDLKRFRALTRGKIVIMGRKTFESIGRLLPDRENWILSRARDYEVQGARMFRDWESVKSALAALPETNPEREVFVIGGAEIYRLALPDLDRIYLTLVHAELEGDAYFPEIPAEFREAHPPEKQNAGLNSEKQISENRGPAFEYQLWIR